MEPPEPLEASESIACEIVVDTNSGEDDAFEALKEAEPDAVRRERLDVGDIVLRAGGSTVIIERKATADLASSLSDHRYHEQKSCDTYLETHERLRLLVTETPAVQRRVSDAMQSIRMAHYISGCDESFDAA